MITKHLQIKFDMSDPEQRALCKAVGKMPRGIKNTFVVQLFSAYFGKGTTEELRLRMLDFVFRRDGKPFHTLASEGDLEDGHKEHDAQSQPISRPPKSESLEQKPKKKRGRPPKSDSSGIKKTQSSVKDEPDNLMM